MYISVRGRLWMQAEAANMVESVGQYVKQRRVPVMVKEGASLLTFFVPAISGESIAHAYQLLLAEELKKSSENVCKYCEKGIFLKSSDDRVLKDALGFEAKTKDIKPYEIEEAIVKGCGVEDIGGFLYTGNPNVKRTSSFAVGYMIPVKEALKMASIDPQLQSRYALGTKFMRAGDSSQAAGQMIYYVEISSALFAFAFDLDTAYIGKYHFDTEKYGQSIQGVDATKRAAAALDAVKRLLVEFPVGAKRTRFNPADLRWDSLSIAVSDGVWTMPSAFSEDYMDRAVAKKQSFSANTSIYSFNEEKEKCKGDKCLNSPEEATTTAITDAKSRIRS
ncbi:type I-A CRISPR-associated protein Cas7/Csa2 [Tardisphaera miroshnichenkoae]